MNSEPLQVATGTPPRWAEYLAFLRNTYKEDMSQWEAELRAVKIGVGGWGRLKTLWQGIQAIESVEWRKPYKSDTKYMPSVVGYYNWDVRTPHKPTPKVS